MSDSDPYKDTVDRLQRIVDLQIEGIRRVDSIALHLAKLTLLLIGAILTVFSIIVGNNGQLIIEVQQSSLVILIGSLLSLSISLIFSYLCLATTIISYGGAVSYSTRNSPQEYWTSLSDKYGESTRENKEVMQKKFFRYRIALATLLDGVLLLLLSIILYIIRILVDYAYIILIIILAFLVFFTVNMIRGSYGIYHSEGNW